MIFFQVFKNLLGTGRAWRLVGDIISALIAALASPFEEIRRQVYRILYCPFLGEHPYATEEEQLSDTENYEAQFGIAAISDVLSERQSNVLVQWALVGGQGFKYIEDVLARAGIQAHIIENLPVKDLSFIGAHEYGFTQYGQSINDVPVQYGGSGYILIGNGLILDKNTLHDPVKITDWSKVFIIEVENTLSYGQYELFINTLLRVKPGDLACLAKLRLS